MAEWENAPSSAGVLGILVGLTLKAKPWALFFLPGAQSTCGRGYCLSQYNPNLSIDLCNTHCSGLEKNGKLHREEISFLQFLGDISEGSSEGLEFPKPESP